MYTYKSTDTEWKVYRVNINVFTRSQFGKTNPSWCRSRLCRRSTPRSARRRWWSRSRPASRRGPALELSSTTSFSQQPLFSHQWNTFDKHNPVMAAVYSCCCRLSRAHCENRWVRGGLRVYIYIPICRYTLLGENSRSVCVLYVCATWCTDSRRGGEAAESGKSAWIKGEKNSFGGGVRHVYVCVVSSAGARDRCYSRTVAAIIYLYLGVIYI